MNAEEKKPEYGIAVEQNSDDGLIDNVDGLHRRLSNRQIQFIAIGGSLLLNNKTLNPSSLLTRL
jgi:amino acid permease